MRVRPSTSVIWVERLSMQIKSGQLDTAKIWWNLLENKIALCPGAWLVACSFFMLQVTVGCKFCPWESMLLQIHTKAYSLPSARHSLLNKGPWYKWEKWQEVEENLYMSELVICVWEWGCLVAANEAFSDVLGRVEMKELQEDAW